MPQAVDAAPTAGDRTWLDRALSVFTEVRAGEGASALLLALNVFWLLAFYYILKTVRESLILSVQLQPAGGAADSRDRPRGQDPREQHRLFDSEHRAARAVPSDEH